MPLHFIMRDGLDIELPVVLGDGGLVDLQAQIAMSSRYRAEGMDMVPLEVDGMRLAIRADDIVAFYSEDEAGRISLRHTGSSDKHVKIQRDDRGRIAGISPA
jgi:hypothetical protein